MQTARRCKNPVLDFDTPQLPSPEVVLLKAKGKEYLDDLYVRPMFIDEGSPRLMEKLKNDPDALFHPIPEDCSPQVKQMLLERRAQSKKIASEVGRKWDVIMYDCFQMSLPPGLRRSDWTPTKKTRMFWKEQYHKRHN